MEARLEEKHQELQRVRVRAERPRAVPGRGGRGSSSARRPLSLLLPAPLPAERIQRVASSARCLLIGAPATWLPAGGVSGGGGCLPLGPAWCGSGSRYRWDLTGPPPTSLRCQPAVPMEFKAQRPRGWVCLPGVWHWSPRFRSRA